MSQEILGYTANGDPIHQLKPGTMATACCISCSVCGEGICGMGGPNHDAKCVACSDKRVLLRKSYSSEETCDLSRDLHEAFDPRFTPEAEGIPKDEHGFDKGTFELVLTWRAEE